MRLNDWETEATYSRKGSFSNCFPENKIIRTLFVLFRCRSRIENRSLRRRWRLHCSNHQGVQTGSRTRNWPLGQGHTTGGQGGCDGSDVCVSKWATGRKMEGIKEWMKEEEEFAEKQTTEKEAVIDRDTTTRERHLLTHILSPLDHHLSLPSSRTIPSSYGYSTHC